MRMCIRGPEVEWLTSENSFTNSGFLNVLSGHIGARSYNLSSPAVTSWLRVGGTKILPVRIPYRGAQGLLHLRISSWCYPSPVRQWITRVSRLRGRRMECAQASLSSRLHFDCRTMGGPKRRLWRKIHIAIDEQTLEIWAVEVTISHIGDAPMMPLGSRRKCRLSTPQECQVLEANLGWCDHSGRSSARQQLPRTDTMVAITRAQPQRIRVMSVMLNYGPLRPSLDALFMPAALSVALRIPCNIINDR